MTDKEKCKARELIGKLKVHREALGFKIETTRSLRAAMITDAYHGQCEGYLRGLLEWQEWNADLLAAIEQLLKEIEDDREYADLPL